MQNNAVQSQYMRAEKGELKGGILKGLIQEDFPEEASLEVKSSGSAQRLSPELARGKKTAWAETHGQEDWG